MRCKSIIITSLLFAMLMQTGCWDMIEIENRALIGAILIDITDIGKEVGRDKTNEDGSPFCEEQPNNIKVVFGVNLPSKAAKGEKDAGVPIEVEAANIPDAMELLGSKIPRVPFYGQVRLLILSRQLIENESVFRQVLDEFERKAVINQNMKIVVFEGKVDRIFQTEPKIANLRSTSIVGIMKNAKVLSNTVDYTLAHLTSDLRNGGGRTTIPLLEISEDKGKEFTVNKLVLVKDYKYLETLDTKYIKSYKIITDKMQMGRKLIKYDDAVVPYYIASSKRKIYLEDSNENLKFRVKVEFEGDVEQYKFDEMLFDPKIIKAVEKKIEDTTKKELEETTKYFKEGIGEDYLGFRSYTNKYHNRIYNKYKDNWEEAFKNAEIVYQVDASIRRIGTSKK